MQTPTDKTSRMLLKTEEELFNTVIDENHPFRRLNELIDFETTISPLRDLYSDWGQKGIDVNKGFKALLVQFWEDYSDRQMEKAVKENLAIRWFAGFGLCEETPDYSYFSKLRRRIGPSRLSNIFKTINQELESQGLFGNVFTFIDASAIVSKTALWEERDQAIKDGEEKLNNVNVKKYAADKDARWGAKSKKKLWFGYKRHQATDMRHGLVKKVAVTPANVPDFKVLKNICPDQGAVFTDKLYDCQEADQVIELNGCHPATIRKKNNQRKNKDLDRWRSKVRMPFESAFSKLRKRAKFRGLTKINFQCVFEAICHNLKKAITIIPTETAS
jgi:transposase, IS5 family